MYPSISSYPRLSTLLPSTRTAHCSSDAAKVKGTPVGSLQYASMCGLGGALAGGLVSGWLPLEYGLLVNPTKFSPTPVPSGSAVPATAARRFFSPPTVARYSMQGAALFGVYEGFKKLSVAALGEEHAYNKSFLLYAPAAAAAYSLSYLSVNAKAMRSAAIQFTLYEWISGLEQRTRKVEWNTFDRLLCACNAGCWSGIVCAIITHPYADPGRVERLELAKKFRVRPGPILFLFRAAGMGTACGLQWAIYEGFKIATGLSPSSPLAVPESLRKKLEETKKG